MTEAGIAFETFDALYERSRSYEAIVRAIVREVRRLGKECSVCYCVDGSPAEDRAAQALMKYAQTQVVDGVSKASAAAVKAGIGNFLALSAYDAAEAKLALPLVVYDLADAALAGDVKLALCNAFGDDAPALFVRGGRAEKIALWEADRQKCYDATCALVVPEIPLLEKKRFDLEDCLAVLRRLRAPDGCPWDRAQTHKSIRINAIEEAYELVDAIDADDPAKMCEEAGDVIMQAAFHTLIEEERGNFNMTDVLSGICEKLITRHTHVFGQDKAAGADGALSVWEKNKMREKHQTTYTQSLYAVPGNFPACMRAQKVGKRAAKCGMDFLSPVSASEKLGEEAAELIQALKQGDERAVFEESGDLLFSAVNTCRLAGVDSEQALAAATDKFIKRFEVFESLAKRDGKNLNDMCSEEYDWYWLQAKNATKKD